MLTLKHINEQIVLGLLDLSLFQLQQPNLPKRELEKQGSLFVLKHLFNDQRVNIQYSQSGKPYIENRSEHISISHSHDRLALIVNKTHNTGVDIELIRDKVKQVKHKFLNAAEALAAGESIEHLVRFWAAKETLYKIYGLKELDFIENLAVEDFEDNKIIGKITKHHFHQKQLLHWEKLGQYILVYSVHEI